MFEIGYSELVALLDLDLMVASKFAGTDPLCEFSFFIKISRYLFRLQIESWMMDPPATGIGDSCIPKCEHNFDINWAEVVISTLHSQTLEIDCSCTFDQYLDTAQPIKFTLLELSFFGTRLFHLLKKKGHLICWVVKSIQDWIKNFWCMGKRFRIILHHDIIRGLGPTVHTFACITWCFYSESLPIPWILVHFRLLHLKISFLI